MRRARRHAAKDLPSSTVREARNHSLLGAAAFSASPRKTDVHRSIDEAMLLTCRGLHRIPAHVLRAKVGRVISANSALQAHAQPTNSLPPVAAVPTP